jgi:hypothetical protein
MVYFSSDDEIEKQFETKIKGRFQITLNGPAEWFLQMRIHAYSCLVWIDLTVNKICTNFVNRYNQPDAPWGCATAQRHTNSTNLRFYQEESTKND